MEYRLYIVNLYDAYSSLLTEKQSTYFEEYYFNNLTLGELSENYGISRNGVYKQIKEAEEKLKVFEEKLKIVEKNNKIKELIVNIDKNIQNKIIDIL